MDETADDESGEDEDEEDEEEEEESEEEAPKKNGKAKVYIAFWNVKGRDMSYRMDEIAKKNINLQ